LNKINLFKNHFFLFVVFYFLTGEFDLDRALIYL